MKVKNGRIIIVAIAFISAFVLLTTLASVTALDCGCGDLCVNESGWWRDGGAFNASETPIQAAVDNATAGETICVQNGTYNENVDVYKRLTIRSAYGSENCIVRAKDSNHHVFHVKVNWVNITGFTVQNATMNVTACFDTSHPATGIYLDLVMHCNISDNNATNNCNGINLYGSSNNILSGNTANGNVFRGILLNSMIPLFYSDHNYLTKNTANRNYRGISLLFANSNILTENTANSNDNIGFEFVQSNDNNFTSNTANLNNFIGLYLSQSNDNNFTSNTVNSNTIAGFWLQNSHDNNITCNWIHNNSRYGFYLLGGSTGNTIAYNSIEANGVEQADGSWKYNFVNEQSNTVTAEDNYWGTKSSAVIAASISQDPGLVDYDPFLDYPAPCAPFEAPQFCIEIEKQINGLDYVTATPGETLEVTLWINNCGNVNLTNLSVVDHFPIKKFNAGLSYADNANPVDDGPVSSYILPWIYFVVAWRGNVPPYLPGHLTPFEPLQPGENFTITFEATVDELAEGPYDNCATVSANYTIPGAISGTVNATDCATVFVPSPIVSEVPILTPIGVVALVSLLAAIAAVTLVRKRH